MTYKRYTNFSRAQSKMNDGQVNAVCYKFNPDRLIKLFKHEVVMGKQEERLKGN